MGLADLIERWLPTCHGSPFCPNECHRSVRRIWRPELPVREDSPCHFWRCLGGDGILESLHGVQNPSAGCACCLCPKYIVYSGPQIAGHIRLGHETLCANVKGFLHQIRRRPLTHEQYFGLGGESCCSRPRRLDFRPISEGRCRATPNQVLTLSAFCSRFQPIRRFADDCNSGCFSSVRERTRRHGS